MRFTGRVLSRYTVFIFLILLCAAQLWAQAAGTLRGQVTDPSGAVVQGAAVTAKSESGQTTTTKTGKLGTYEVKGLTPGKYTVSVSAKGFSVASQDVDLTTGKDQKLDVRLEIAVEQQQVAVEETQSKVDIGSENNASAMVIKGKDLEALSDDPDELSSELQALAGPAAGPNGGQMYIDGFSGGTLPPKASIREIRVNQNPFSAQYDHLGYGRIEIFTKPGTDKFHGQLMFRDSPSGLNASNPFALHLRPTYDAQQVEGNIGGPAGKKGSFFLNVEDRNTQDHRVVNAFTSLDANNNAVRFTQAVPNPGAGIEISPRFDYQISANNTLTSRFEYNRSHYDNESVGGLSLASQAINSHSSEINAQISDTQIVNARTVNETRFQYVRSISSQSALSSLLQISVLGAFVDGGNSAGRTSSSQDHYELQNYTSMALGNHFVRFGGRLRGTAETDSQIQNFNGTYTFSSLQSYLITQQGLASGLTPAQIRSMNPNVPDIGPTQFSINAGNPFTSNTSVDAGLYVEEDWKVRPDLMFSHGLRFETQNDIHDRADWAPRVGLAWAPGGTKNASPKTILRAGFGIFYDRFGQNLILQALRQNGINQQQFSITSSQQNSRPILDLYPSIPPISALTGVQALTVRQIDTRLRSPYTMQLASSVERQLTKTANMSITYLHSRGVHELLSRNINAPLPSGQYPLGQPGSIYQYQSEGIFNQNQLIANFSVRGKVLSLFGFYMLNYVKGDTSGASSFPVNQYDLAADYGRLSYDIRHRLFFGGSVALPYGFRFNPFMVVNSGAPFNITVGKDVNADSIPNDRPAFATSSSQSPVPTRFGTFDLNPSPGEKIIPINFGTEPARYSLNARLSKTFGFGGSSSQANTGARGGPGGGGPRGGGEGRGGGGGGEGMGRIFGGMGGGSEQRYNLTFTIGAFNLFNHVNLSDPIGNLSSSTFGRANTLAGGPFSPPRTFATNRRIDLQMNFSF
ncbi:MAG TPA: carboxypeptidase regulatory-like domain-containing protein [Terriglobales bacterium]|nr:carboxypeptidase regulatory-like domain-containing protein [Terriglobales bacterium]